MNDRVVKERISESNLVISAINISGMVTPEM